MKVQTATEFKLVFDTMMMSGVSCDLWILWVSVFKLNFGFCCDVSFWLSVVVVMAAVQLMTSADVLFRQYSYMQAETDTYPAAGLFSDLPVVFAVLSHDAIWGKKQPHFAWVYTDTSPASSPPSYLLHTSPSNFFSGQVKKSQEEV